MITVIQVKPQVHLTSLGLIRFSLNRLKLVIAAIFANLSVSVVDTSSTEPATDALTIGPKGDRLILRFRRL